MSLSAINRFGKGLTNCGSLFFIGGGWIILGSYITGLAMLCLAALSHIIGQME